ncbi:MAG: YgiQ family radical SAM protein [Oscillospiraceae bacterium]|nr:YgiQ family radical SAM protein [Oscillospiraceae bacterium]
MTDFLPITKKEMDARGWDQADFVFVTGDAYVDHPSFGVAILSRLLESMGFRVAILSQPDFRSEKDFRRFGRPKYAFLITAGAIDSMVAHYTAAKRLRSDDAYTPGNKAGKRPDRAATVYSQLAKQAYPDCPVVLGGIEASLRRFAHYDYWDDCVHPSILVSSGADIVSYGMGEHQTAELARRFAEGKTVKEMRDIRGICYLTDPGEALPDLGEHVSCASYEKVRENKLAYAKAAALQLSEQDGIYGKPIVQKHGDRFLVQTAPSPVLTREELDEVFSLPFQRYYHPSYEALGGVKAIEEVEFSIMQNRGCFGACNFCAIAMHQGRQVVSRSQESILAEAESFTRNPRFKGYIHDVGGPTANFRHPACQKQLTHGVCKNRKCLAPTPCKNLIADHSDYIDLLRKLRAIPKVKKVFIRSGIRFDYVNQDKSGLFMDELVRHHVSGQLKVAPEHCANPVLEKMGKPAVSSFETFCKNFYSATKRAGKEQYLVPYLMSSHPGSRLQDAVELAVWLKRNHMRPEQVQDFYPTPGTISTAMFYTGLDPYTLKPVYVARTPAEKRQQRILLQYFKPENRREVTAALIAAGRRDLIGNGPDCLVPAPSGQKRPQQGTKTGEHRSQGRAPQSSRPSGAKGAKRGRR